MKGDAPATFEGGAAVDRGPLVALQRSVMACMLWEDDFYESGEEIGDRIARLVSQVSCLDAVSIAVSARNSMKLRHAPLLVMAAACKAHSGNRSPGSLLSDGIEKVVQRPDELAEFLAIVAKVNNVGPRDLKRVLSNQVRKGLAKAFGKFDEYQLAKWNPTGDIRYADILRLCHPKPIDSDQAALWRRAIDGALAKADTWEQAFTSGSEAKSDAEKRAHWERLLRENRLGYMALLKNLRGMLAVGVDESLITMAIRARVGAGNVLPFRFVTAAAAAPEFYKPLDEALRAQMEMVPAFNGSTTLLIDVSYSMTDPVSSRSSVRRVDAAAALAAITKTSGNLRTFVFNNRVNEVHTSGGLGMVDRITLSVGGGTNLSEAVAHVNDRVKSDRLIVITDEQSSSWDPVPAPVAPIGYMINVGTSERAVAAKGGWVRLDGFSENVLKYAMELERDTV